MTKRVHYLVFLILLAAIFPANAQRYDALESADVRIYKHATGEDLKISIVYPENYRKGRKYPAILFFHGGGWNRGSVQQFEHHCHYLASRGMIAMTASYRVQSRNGTTPFEAVKDARSAMRWVRQHAAEIGIHKKKIIVGGGSAGGHLALCTAILDHVNDAGDDLSISPVPDAMVLFNPVANTMPEGYGFDVLGERAEELSPYHHIDGDVPPAIIFHGGADSTVPVSNVEDFCDAMKESGNRCELIVYADQAHGFFNYGKSGHAFYMLTVAEMDRFLQSLGYLPKKDDLNVTP